MEPVGRISYSDNLIFFCSSEKYACLHSTENLSESKFSNRRGKENLIY